MCLFSYEKPKVAEKDLVCYKMIKSDYSAYIHPNFKYVLGRLNVTKFSIHSDIDRSPYFDNFAQDTFISSKDTDINPYIISRGFHSAKRLERYIVDGIPNYNIIGKFIIPKGSTYYTDNSGLVVSDKIIFTEVMVDFMAILFQGHSRNEFIDKFGDKHTFVDKPDLKFLNSWEY